MLFRKECKKIFRSLTYLIFCVLVIVMFATQYFQDCNCREYPPGKYNDDYGYKVVEDHDIIMTSAANALTGEYFTNRYVCYPFGFYKAVHLNEKEQSKIFKYLMEITGLDGDGIADLQKSATLFNFDRGYSEYEVEEVPVSESMNYERFVEIMTDVDDILGGGSDYAPDGLVYKFSRVPMTYEDALEEYDKLFKDDHITGAYARLFADYTGIVLGIMPVFVAAALMTADRRRRMNELIYSRSVSSLKLVFTRYAALMFTMFIPVLLTMIVAFIQLLNVYSGEKMNMTVMFTLPSFWLVPNIMFASAIGMALSEIFSAGFAILFQFVFWFAGILTGPAALYGETGKFTFVCRHNTLGHRDVFMLYQDNFIFSRIFYMVISLAIVVFTAFIYEMKRGGRFNGIRLFGKDSIFRRKA